MNVNAIENMEKLATLEDAVNSDVSKSEAKEIEPHYLSEDGLLLYIIPEDKPFPSVPPSTPKELISNCYVTVLPELPDNLKNINIPYIRECGIRDSIDALAKYFKCEDFKNNLVHFWFLDMLVDCIWRAQDEYNLSIQGQEVLLEWILFVIKLITSKNMTKQLMFEIFNEALEIAENYVQSGSPQLPTPNALFTVTPEETEEEEDKAPNFSFMSFFSNLEKKEMEEIKVKSSKQYLVIKLEEDVKIFKVPNKDTVIEDCLSSSIDPLSENEFRSVGEPTESIKLEETTDTESSTEFYRPKMSTPTRFKSLQNFAPTNQDSESIEQKIESDSIQSVKEWLNIPRKQLTPECPSQFIKKKIDVSAIHPKDILKSSLIKVKEPESSIETAMKKSERTQEEKEIVLDKEHIFKIYYDYNMWQLKNEYMAEPNIGWTPSLISYKNVLKNDKLRADSKTKSVLKKLGIEKDDRFVEREKNIFINLCILMAVKQIVFEYFNYNFSFELVRTSLKYPQYLITQDINSAWYIPKEIKGELKKPMPKKPKKEKAKKEKKPPKEKKDKASKKSKSTKGSKDKAKDKKGKDKKSKSDAKSKSSKKGEKDKKISKEEKKEMDRLKKEEEEIEKQRVKDVENKMFMFPLKEAVDDDFFLNLFSDYKPKKAGKKGDKKQDKKHDKNSKASKSDKSSKNEKKAKRK